MTRFDPSGPLRGSLRPPADKSISHRAALIAAMGEGETRDRGLPRRRRHALDAGRGRGAGRAAVDGAGDGPAAPRRSRIRAASACAAPAPADDRRRQRRHPAAAAAGLAGRAGRRPAGRSTATTRSAAARSTASPRRCAQMGAELSCREERLPPLEIARRAAARDRVRAAGRQRPGQVLPALRRPAGRGRDPGRRAAADPRPQRADARRRRRRGAPRAARATAPASVVIQPAERLEAERIVVPADLSSAAFFVVAALLVPGSEVVIRGRRPQPDPDRAADDPRADGGRDRGRRRAASRAASRSATCGSAPPSLRATEVGGAEVPLAIDELPLVALAACFAEGTTTIRDAAELRRKESDRIATVSRGPERARRRGRADRRTAWSIEGTGGLRGGAIDSHGDHRIAMLGAVAGLASREGVEVQRHGRGRGQLPRLRGRPRLAARRLTTPDAARGTRAPPTSAASTLPR